MGTYKYCGIHSVEAGLYDQGTALIAIGHVVMLVDVCAVEYYIISQEVKASSMDCECIGALM